MDSIRLKTKIGEHEFDAEGPREVVDSQYKSWLEAIASQPRQKESTPAVPAIQSQIAVGEQALELDKIFRAEGRVVSLSAPPESEQEAALLVLLGQRHYRSNERVTGGEVMVGLQQSGYRLPRVDRLLEGLADEGLVIRSGQHRATRYRLSNNGLIRAQAIAREVIGRVA